MSDCDLPPLSGDTGPPPRRVFVFLGCDLRSFTNHAVTIGQQTPPRDSRQRFGNCSPACSRQEHLGTGSRDMPLTLNEASKHSGFAKSSLSKAIAKGRLSAVRLGNKTFSIEEEELARFVEASAPPVRLGRVETLPSVQSGTAVDDVVAARVRADVAEQMLLVLKAQLDEMKARLVETAAQRDRWEQRFDQLKLPSGNPGERRRWWRWRKTA